MSRQLSLTREAINGENKMRKKWKEKYSAGEFPEVASYGVSSSKSKTMTTGWKSRYEEEFCVANSATAGTPDELTRKASMTQEQANTILENFLTKPTSAGVDLTTPNTERAEFERNIKSEVHFHGSTGRFVSAYNPMYVQTPQTGVTREHFRAHQTTPVDQQHFRHKDWLKDFFEESAKSTGKILMRNSSPPKAAK